MINRGHLCFRVILLGTILISDSHMVAAQRGHDKKKRNRVRAQTKEQQQQDLTKEERRLFQKLFTFIMAGDQVVNDDEQSLLSYPQRHGHLAGATASCACGDTLATYNVVELREMLQKSSVLAVTADELLFFQYRVLPRVVYVCR